MTLGYDDARRLRRASQLWGQTIGRYANRIAGGRFTLDGKTYQLPLNDKTNSLHGGTIGFDKRNVADRRRERQSRSRQGRAAAGQPRWRSGLSRQSHGDRHLPLDDRGALTIDFDASTDAPTIVNLTNHALFNLAGEGAPGGALTHRLTIPAHALHAGQRGFDSNWRVPGLVAGPSFHFTSGQILPRLSATATTRRSSRFRGYDHNFALDARPYD